MRFLRALGETGVISHACEIAGVNRQYAYEARERDAEFRLKWAELDECAIEVMEREAYARAVDGWCERGIFDDEGELIGEVRKFSDSLLMFLLKARRPAVYRENVRLEHSGPEGGPITAETTIVDKRKRSDAARQYLATIADDE